MFGIKRLRRRVKFIAQTRMLIFWAIVLSVITALMATRKPDDGVVSHDWKLVTEKYGFKTWEFAGSDGRILIITGGSITPAIYSK